MGLFDFFTTTIGIDAGSENLRLIKEGQIIFDEKHQLSLDRNTDRVSGIGNGSLAVEPNELIRLVDYTIADFHGFECLLRGALQKKNNKKSWLQPSHRMYFSIPGTATEVDKRAYRGSGDHAGAKEVYFVPAPCASAIGMGILFEKENFLLIDFSASKTEITAFSNATPVAWGHLRLGAWKLKRHIRNYLYRTYSIASDDWEINQMIEACMSLNRKETQPIRNIEVPTEDVLNILELFFRLIDNEVSEVLETISKDPNFDKIISNGVFFTGGFSLTSGIHNRLCLNGRLPYTISPAPLLDTIRGIAKVIDNPKGYRRFISF